LVKIYLSSIKAYLLKEDFQEFGATKDKLWADEFLENQSSSLCQTGMLADSTLSPTWKT
jgi:hypothetical protein